MAIRLALARRISEVLNPVVSIAGLMVLAVVRDAPGRAGVFLFAGLLFGAVVPLAYVWHLRRRGIIDGYFVSERRQRLRPLQFSAGSCWMGVVVLLALDAPAGLLAVAISVAVQAVAMLGLTGFTRVSLHASGIWSGWVIAWMFYGLPALALLPLPFLVGWARLVLGAHTPGQVALGSCAGGGLTWLVFLFMFG